MIFINVRINIHEIYPDIYPEPFRSDIFLAKPLSARFKVRLFAGMVHPGETASRDQIPDQIVFPQNELNYLD